MHNITQLHYRKRRKKKEIRTYSSSSSSKVIDLDVNRKRIFNFLLLITINFEHTYYRFRGIDA